MTFNSPEIWSRSETELPPRMLLNALWPTQNLKHQIWTRNKSTKRFVNLPANDAADAASCAQDLSRAGSDVYFACAEFLSEQSREAIHAQHACGFWMDFDCGDDKAEAGKGYRSTAEALDAIDAFCGTTRLPAPSFIVDSGGGLHVYWVFDQPLAREAWQREARKLKNLAKHHGLLADPTRTADIASILRIPGTLNYKYNPPRPVLLRHAANNFNSTDSVLSSIDSALHAVDSHTTGNGNTANEISSDSDIDLRRLASALMQLDPDDEEPIWTLRRIAPLARAARCNLQLQESLFDLCKRWSSGALRGNPSTKWITRGKNNGQTGAEAFEKQWVRFLSERHNGNEITLDTIYFDAINAGWVANSNAKQGGPSTEADSSLAVSSANQNIATENIAERTNPLALVQQAFSLIDLDGRIWVLNHRSLNSTNPQGIAKKLILSNRTDGTLLIQRQVRAQFPSTDPDAVVRAFYTDPKTRCFEGVEFNPARTSPNYLNLWVGPTAQAQPGDWKAIRSFLLEIICSGDLASYNYLISYVAHAIQRPWEKPGVMVILIGGQGIGKGTLGRILRKIWSATYLHIHKIEDVTGNFNASLERGYIVFMDEALFVGDRKASDALKSLVTEPVIQINEKHQPARQTRSYHRFFAATNAEHFKNTDHDDRRDFVLKVSESRKDDHDYWKDLNSLIEGSGVSAMIHELLAMDLTGFNIRVKPETPALLEQKLQSLGHIERWWYDALSHGSTSDTTEWPDFLGTKDAIAGIMDFSGGRVFRKPAPIDVVRTLQRLCPSAAKKQQQAQFERHRGLALPTLDQARLEFEQYIGGKVNWDAA